MRDFQETIDEIFSEIEIQLSAKLLSEGFRTHSQISTPEVFGSRYTEWRNDTEKNALRLIWDGKGRWFSVEESPFMNNNDPNSWADVVLVPVDKAKMTDVNYTPSVIEDIISEVK